ADARRRFHSEADRQRELRAGRGDADGGARDRDRDRDKDGFPARLAVTTRQGIVLLAPQEITHLELDGALVTVHTTRGDFLCDLPLQELEQQLAAHGFLRAHRRTLLNLAHVTRLEPVETGGFVA